MKGIIPSSFLENSKEMQHKVPYEELISSPIKNNQILDIKQAKTIMDSTLQHNNNSNKALAVSSNKDLQKLKKFKHKQTLRRTNRAKAKILQSIEENIEDAKNYGFNGRYFEFNEEMKIYNDFLAFPWENYNHDDFLSFMVSHNKTIPEF